MKQKSLENARRIFSSHQGILRASQAKKLGVDETTLVQMHEAGLVVREAFGLYRLADLPPLSKPDWVIVALRAPQAVVCLVSALSFHELTTQIPHQVYIALPRGVKPPRLDFPSLDVIHLSEPAFSAGVEEHIFDGITVRIYNREKTVADCFKFRNKIGQDVAIEALKDYLHQPKRNIPGLLEYARINRVEKVILPYLKGAL